MEIPSSSTDELKDLISFDWFCAICLNSFALSIFSIILGSSSNDSDLISATLSNLKLSSYSFLLVSLIS